MHGAVGEDALIGAMQAHLTADRAGKRGLVVAEIEMIVIIELNALDRTGNRFEQLRDVVDHGVYPSRATGAGAAPSFQYTISPPLAASVRCPRAQPA